MVFFWILWIFNALMSLIPIFFFFEGLSAQTIDEDNWWMWVLILLVVGLVLGGTYWLKTKNQLVVAKVVLILASLPSILALIFILIAIFGDVRWN
jgi:hypothetical protein